MKYGLRVLIGLIEVAADAQPVNCMRNLIVHVILMETENAVIDK